MNLKRADQVAHWRLCLGCGACVPACPNNNIQLVDIQDQGLRPVLNEAKCQQCGQCLKVCPGIEISQGPFDNHAIPQLLISWGQVLEVWEGYATDPRIRFEGSSGGTATALALFCLEKQNFAGVLHIGTKPEYPLRNVQVFSKSREELLRCTGSRYSPAAPCERLNWIQESTAPCVFIGKPCDVVALRKSEAVNAKLNNKVGLAISIFCAGTPATQATHNLLKALGVKPEEVEELRYRGCGWPGAAAVKIKGDGRQIRRMTYEQAWGDILSKHTQFRCRLCPDSTGELADISCGDPWYRKPESGEPGMSLVLVRTEKGRKVVEEAMTAGYIQLQRAGPSALPLSQKSLELRRRHLWGRLLAMRMFLIPVPKYKGFHLFSNWRGLSTGDKVRSVLGTIRRIITRKWWRALPRHSKSSSPHTSNQ
jgi:coenzyme F420 hydrogenase subunit beta